MKEKNRSKLNILIKIFVPLIEWVMAVFAVFFCAKRGFSDLSSTWVFNISADLVCMFISLFFIMGILFRQASAGMKYTRFLLICQTNFFSLFLDFMSWMADGYVSHREIIVLINTLLYISNLCLTAAYGYFVVDMIVTDEKRRRDDLSMILSLFAITIVTRLLNIKFGFFFTVDEFGVYSRGPYQYLSYIYTVFTQLYIIAMLIRSKVSRDQKHAILAFTILPFAASILSIFVYGLSLMYACVLISIVMIYSAFFVELEQDTTKIMSNMEKYISNDIVQKIVDSPSSKLIPGSRYFATVLVSDIRSFTALSEKMSAEDLISMMNHYFGVISDIVSEYNGVVTEFLGDGIKCVFGAPRKTDIDADYAIAAALKIQSKTDEINEWNKEHGFPDIHTGIGINTGTIVMGSLGNERRAKFTAVGQTVDRAFEIESCSLGGQVLVSAATLRNVKSQIDASFIIDYMPDPNDFFKIKIYEVSAIYGDFNVSANRSFKTPSVLEEAFAAKLCPIMGKHEGDLYDCLITAYSDDAVMLKSDLELELMDNIKLELKGKGIVFAKVEAIKPEGVFAVFTSNII